jgi:hypothetical protein
MRTCIEGRILGMTRIATSSLIAVLSVSLVLGTAAVVGAANQTVTFSLNGSGSVLNSPVVFQGMIDSGPMNGGWFVIEIDDTGWPVDNPGTPGNERWSYLLSTFFTYDNTPGGEHWDGYFPLQGGLLPPVIWRFTSGADQLGGVIRYLIISILDSDADGEIDQDELANQTIAANFHSHIEQSQGIYAGWCGFGTGNGNLENFDPNMDDILTLPVGNLYLRNVSCGVPVEETTWGAVKTLYR